MSTLNGCVTPDSGNSVQVKNVKPFIVVNNKNITIPSEIKQNDTTKYLLLIDGEIVTFFDNAVVATKALNMYSTSIVSDLKESRVNTEIFSSISDKEIKILSQEIGLIYNGSVITEHVLTLKEVKHSIVH